MNLNKKICCCIALIIMILMIIFRFKFLLHAQTHHLKSHRHVAVFYIYNLIDNVMNPMDFNSSNSSKHNLWPATSKWMCWYIRYQSNGYVNASSSIWAIKWRIVSNRKPKRPIQCNKENEIKANIAIWKSRALVAQVSFNKFRKLKVLIFELSLAFIICSDT